MFVQNIFKIKVNRGNVKKIVWCSSNGRAGRFDRLKAVLSAVRRGKLYFSFTPVDTGLMNLQPQKSQDDGEHWGRYEVQTKKFSMAGVGRSRNWKCLLGD